MTRTKWLQETKKIRFEEAYCGWTSRRLTQTVGIQRDGDQRSYGWVKNTLQKAGVAKMAPRQVLLQDLDRLHLSALRFTCVLSGAVEVVISFRRRCRLSQCVVLQFDIGGADHVKVFLAHRD